MERGKLIVLEGLDGCGKSTQLDLVENYITMRGENCRAVSFPVYNSPTGELILDYLAGKIPCEGINGAYAASSLYAMDRYISYVNDWKKNYDDGVVITGRYTTSNAIFQMTKVEHAERDEFLDWLWRYEYVQLGLPQPDLVLFLDMPVAVAQKLLMNRYSGDVSKRDIHETNTLFMEKCRESAVYTAEKRGWVTIPCANGDEPLPIEDVYNAICAQIDKLL